MKRVMRIAVLLLVFAGAIALGCAKMSSGPSRQYMMPQAVTQADRQSLMSLDSSVMPAGPTVPATMPPPSTEAYAPIEENTFKTAQHTPLSTFSIDVDTASYANVRRFLNDGTFPPPDAVRIEEMVNYFDYSYPQPAPDAPFSVTVDVGPCPWVLEHRIARIGLKGREIAPEKKPPTNLVFLLDVSGSMDEENKLPLVKRALHLLVPQLQPDDRLAIVTYAGSSGVALKSTRCTADNRRRILDVIDGLVAGGSTHGSAGLVQAYDLANDAYKRNGVNRVVLATDGDFNVGVTDNDKLVKLITDNAKNGVFLTVLGFGMGNLKDDRLEDLADKGNGNYGYIDSLTEARKVLLEEMTGTLVTIAKDVKIQVEFNPMRVAGYRLIGYENRLLKDEEFNDDTKDAGEIGAGHTVTALYEIVPAGVEVPDVKIDDLRYQDAQLSETARGDELMLVKIRYKEPKGTESSLLSFPVTRSDSEMRVMSTDYCFATAVAAFGMLLRDSDYVGKMTYENVIELANGSRGTDELGYRAEFVNLVRNAAALAPAADDKRSDTERKSSRRQPRNPMLP